MMSIPPLPPEPHRTRRLPVLVTLGALIATGISCSPAAEEPVRPDVILISLDSVRADFLTFRDAETAPYLTELAKRGTIFTQAISGTSWTLPAHLEMLTGMPPALHGVQDDDLRLDPLLPTAPELLRDVGYDCLGFWTCWYLAGEYGFEDGFHLWQNSMVNGDNLEVALDAAMDLEGDLGAKRKRLREAKPTERSITSRIVVENLRSTLAEADPDRPLFLFTHFYDPHFDYIPPSPWDEKFDPDYAGNMDGNGFWANKNIFDQEKKPSRQISDRDLEHIRALYRGEIAWTDDALGAMLEELERSGRLDNTLIIITADHGEEFFEHGERGHRRTLYEEVIRVPLLVVPPASMAKNTPRVRDDQVCLADILPTMLDYAGIAVPGTVYGRSMRPLVEGGSRAPEPVLLSLCQSIADPRRGMGKALLEGIRTPEYKITRGWVQFENDPGPQMQMAEYCDLLTDPGEQRLVRTPDHPGMQKAWRELDRRTNAARARWDGRRRTPIESLRTDVGRIVGKELEALGYAGADHAGETTQLRNPLGVGPVRLPRIPGGRGR